MKRTKPSLQPTRIMPKRGKRQEASVDVTEVDEQTQVPVNLPLENSGCPKTVKRAVADNLSSSESPSEGSASVSASGGHSSHRKRKKLVTDSSVCSKSSPASDAMASADNRSNRESPELGCSICLGAVENRAFTDACYHTFCFECLVEWSRVRAVCPLCKKSFHSIIHSFRSYDDYKLYQVPTSYVSNCVNMSSVSNTSNFSRIGRFWSIGTPTMPPLNDSDHMLALRRRVYTQSDEMQLRGLWSSDGVVVSPPHPVSPAMFDCYPVMLERVRPWVLRDVAVIIGNGDVQIVANIVLDLLRHFPITSEDFYERLFPFLGLHTRRFLLELDAFARSPFDMTTYDARVVYSTGSNAETSLHLRREHTEDISSSDDSDIEIVTPSVVTSSDTTLNTIRTMTDHVVPDLLRCLRTFQHNLLMSFSFMNPQRSNSGLESPVPGPSGLGQAAATDESGSTGSHASRSAYDAEDRSNSPLVLSDADSDVVVIDIDRPTRSPIHISSGEDDHVALPRRAHRQVKRRRRRKKAYKKHRMEFEPTDSLTRGAELSVEPKAVLAADNEVHMADLVPSDQLVESRVEELMHAAGGNENDRVLSQPSSCSHSIELNDCIMASANSSPAESYCHESDRKMVKTPKQQAHHHSHPRRLKSADSVSSMPVISRSDTDDVKPLMCKKHISGHKSSKQKGKELVAERRSSEVVGNNSEKLATVDGVGTSVGSDAVSDGGSSEQHASENPTEVAVVPSMSESSVACGIDLKVNSLSVCKEMNAVQKLASVGESDTETPVPSTSSASLSMPPVSSSDSGLEPTQCSPFSTVKATCDDIESQLLHSADDNSPSCDTDPTCSDVCDEAPTRTAEKYCNIMDSCDDIKHTAALLALDSELSAADSEQTVSGNVSTGSVNVGIASDQQHSPLPFDPCVKYERNDGTSELPSSISSPAASSSVLNTVAEFHSDNSCELGNQYPNKCCNLSLQNDFPDGSVIIPRECEGTLSADTTSDSASCLCKGENRFLSLPFDVCNTRSELVSADSQSADYSLANQLASSPLHAGFAIDESETSAAYQNPVVGDRILSGGLLESESSDSELEWLETNVLRRDRCISISSTDSSVVCSSSDVDDVESVLMDTDSLEMLETPQAGLTPQSQSADSQRQNDEHRDGASEEKAEETTLRYSDATSATFQADEPSSNTTLQSNPVAAADSGNEDSDTDVSLVEELVSRQ